jgi:hypothetical protein
MIKGHQWGENKRGGQGEKKRLKREAGLVKNSRKLREKEGRGRNSGRRGFKTLNHLTNCEESINGRLIGGQHLGLLGQAQILVSVGTDVYQGGVEEPLKLAIKLASAGESEV